MFKELLIIDSIRGEDSTGVAFINRGNHEATIAKAVGDPFQLFETKQFRQGLGGVNSCIIGHNRSATVGKVVRKNAHPFEFPSIVGVHNGTLRNKYALEKHMDFETDSEAFFFNINQYGIEKAVDKIDGAYTLVWYNKEINTINFLRNKERPLYVVYSEDNRLVFWASEHWMLRGPLLRREYKLGEIQELPIDEHWALTIPDNTKPFDDAVKKAVKSNFFHTGTSTAGSKTTTSTETKGTKFGKIIHLPSTGQHQDALKGRATIIRPISWNKDVKGAFVIDALSHEFPMKRFKIYAHTIEECKVVCALKRWNAVIGGQHGSNPNCYKINILSLTEIEEKKAIIPLAHVFKKDHKGFMLDKEEFDKKYSTCSFCGNNLDFDSNWKAFSNEECICDVCLSDQEIVAYLPNIFS